MKTFCRRRPVESVWLILCFGWLTDAGQENERSILDKSLDECEKEIIIDSAWISLNDATKRATLRHCQPSRLMSALGLVHEWLYGTHFSTCCEKIDGNGEWSCCQSFFSSIELQVDARQTIDFNSFQLWIQWCPSYYSQPSTLILCQGLIANCRGGRFQNLMKNLNCWIIRREVTPPVGHNRISGNAELNETFSAILSRCDKHVND